MSESQWAIVIGLLVAVGMRLMDSLLPKGYIFRVVRRWMVEADRDHKAEESDDSSI